MAGSQIANNTVSVAITATQIVGSRIQRDSVTVINTSTTATVYLGKSDVTTANGLPLAPGSTNSLNGISFNELNGPLYGISSSGTVDVRYLEVY